MNNEYADSVCDAYEAWMQPENPAATEAAALCVTAATRRLTIEESATLMVIAFAAGFGAAKAHTEESDARELLADFEGRPQ